MILITGIIVASILVAIVYMIHGVYIKSFEFEGSIKGMKFKFETTEKSAPSSQD